MLCRMCENGLFGHTPLDVMTRLTPRTVRKALGKEQAKLAIAFREYPLKHALIMTPRKENVLMNGYVFMRVPEGLRKELESPEMAIKYITKPQEVWRAFPEYEEAEKVYWDFTHLKATPDEYIRTLKALKEIPTEVLVFRAKVTTVMKTTSFAGSSYWERREEKWLWRKGGLGTPTLWFAVLRIQSNEMDTRALEAITAYTTLPAKYFMRSVDIGSYWELNYLPEDVPEEVKKYIAQQKPTTIHEIVVGYAMTGDRTLRNKLVEVLRDYPEVYYALRNITDSGNKMYERIQDVLAEMEA